MKTTIQSTEIAWEEAGSGLPVVFVHGLPFQKGMWAPQMSVLSKKFKVIALDLPGFGESGDPQGTPSMDSLADLLFQFCQFLSLGPLVLVGHSMGGYAALSFARRYPDQLKGLVMVASRAISDSAEAASNRKSIAARLMAESPEFVAEAMLPRMLATDQHDLNLRFAVRQLMNPLRARGIAWAQLAIASRVDFSPLLGEITAPSLVICGEKDAVVPLEESGVMAAGFQNGRLEVVAKAGHMVSWEQPKAVNDSLQKWMLKL